jgi:nicotinamidase-related amidase
MVSGEQRVLNLRVRYYQDETRDGEPVLEENFVRREIDMALPVAETALVLVDVWNVFRRASALERAKVVTGEAVVPVLEACREVGMAIVHAPSPKIAEQYSQLARHAAPERGPARDWPPREFRARTGAYSSYGGTRHRMPGRKWPYEELTISPEIEVRDDDEVIATGDQLHAFLRERQILHLLYVGFAANYCVIGRDYGIRAMGKRGYNIVLLRDATGGVEYGDTLDRMWATELAIREVEDRFGFTASNVDFLAACGRCR